MDPMMIAIVLGLLGGIVSQLIDKETENEVKAIIRGAVVGVFASLMLYFTGETSPYALGLAGLAGDTIVLNLMKRIRE